MHSIDCTPRTPLSWLTPRLGLGLVLAVAADFMFFDTPAPGLALALVLAALAAASALFNRTRLAAPQLPAASAFLAAGLFVLLLEGSAFNCGLAALTVAVFALSMRRGFGLAALTRPALVLPLTGPFRLIADLWRVGRLTRFAVRLPKLAGVLGWVAPVAALLAFAALLSEGNPLLGQFFDALLSLRLPDLAFLIPHVIFVACALPLIWSLLHVRPARTKRPARRRFDDANGVLFGATPMVRALVLLNALFLLQGGTDIAYLWGRLALPPGMTYAAYAHQSAYPLALTALLAAAFALLALRPGLAGRSRWISPLVLGFTAQNALLVVSAMFRLKLYIAAYGLTELRLAALIWMALVAVGLCLIIARVWRGKSNAWLMEMNFRALACALFVAATLNFPEIIGRYNLAHCRETGGEGPDLDWSYLAGLGPQALPALDAYWPLASVAERLKIAEARGLLAYHAPRGDWRAWSWRSARVKTYLAEHPDPPTQ